MEQKPVGRGQFPLERKKAGVRGLESELEHERTFMRQYVGRMINEAISVRSMDA